ncbi:MAG TPA: ABC transporter permease [Candidatus Methylomirabilis sp.]|nr:ABC transporter permease [Candidatus Methylomirabilis sp.]
MAGPIPASGTSPSAAADGDGAAASWSGRGTTASAGAWRRFRRNRAAIGGLFLVGCFTAVAVVGPWVAPYDPIRQQLDGALQGPSWSHWLGRDELGRDILSRLLSGARVSLGMALGASLIAAVAGVAVGLVAAYRGAAWEEILMRLVDVILAFPGFLLAVAVVSALGPGVANVVIAVGVNTIPGFARITHSAVHAVKEAEHVAAARALGNSSIRILWRHVAPGCLAPIVVQFTLRMGTVVVIASGLSFLGLGAQPPSPEWGAMLSTAREYIRTAPHLSMFPGLAILLLVLAWNVLGDGLTEALNPKLGR